MKKYTREQIKNALETHVKGNYHEDRYFELLNPKLLIKSFKPKDRVVRIGDGYRHGHVAIFKYYSEDDGLITLKEDGSEDHSNNGRGYWIPESWLIPVKNNKPDWL